MTPKQFFEFAKKNGADMVDLKFTDMLGTWQHCSFPIDTWSASTFKNGVGFDGSSIRGWQKIDVSDMLAVPEASTAVMDPFFAEPTVSVIANVVDPITREAYNRDPRHVARSDPRLTSLSPQEGCSGRGSPPYRICERMNHDKNFHCPFVRLFRVLRNGS